MPSGDTGSLDIFPGKHFDSHQSGFLQQDWKDSLESFISTVVIMLLRSMTVYLSKTMTFLFFHELHKNFFTNQL